MTSEKDYILEIFPDPIKQPSSSHHLVKFKVRPQPGCFTRYFRIPIIGVLSVLLTAYVALMYKFDSHYNLLASHLNDRMIRKLASNNYTTSVSFELPFFSVPMSSILPFLFQGGGTFKLNMNVIIYYFAIPVLLMGGIFAAFIRGEPEDVMTVIKDLGIQLHSESKWKLPFSKNKSSENFIPLSSIIDLVIHDGFYGYGQVIFYMCILTRGTAGNEGKLEQESSAIKIVFPQLLPRKDILLKVLQESKKVLFKERRYWRRVPGYGLKQCSGL